MAMRAEIEPWIGGCGQCRTRNEQAEQDRLTTALIAALEQALRSARLLPGELERMGRRGEARERADGSRALTDPRPDLHWTTGRVAELDRALVEARVAFARLGAALALAHADGLTMLTLISRADNTAAGLSRREVEVLRLVAAGRSNREMAAMLCRSERTIERHLENIYRKVGARNRADATAYAHRNNVT
jgi:DNA-binding CsgD family transcriptional regulator